MTQPRPEHPRPGFERTDWINLNGPWTCSLDPGKSGTARGQTQSTGFDTPITVPFCPESRLSGVAHTDFIEAMWYHRTIDVPAAWQGRRILLHFGAVDWESEVYIDGHSVGTHYGGTVSFCHDITDVVGDGGAHQLVVRVRDELRPVGKQPSGKQCPDFASRGCHYTRTTGIWQTVWLEAVDALGLEDVHIVPDLSGGRFLLTPTLRSTTGGATWTAEASVEGSVVARSTGTAADGNALSLELPEPRAWSPADPFLYDLHFSVTDAAGQVVDEVASYAGLRSVHIESDRVLLNGEPLYFRFVLDQGFYPEGIWTAPTDADLRRDIELAQAAGFNGARLHQKVFEERFHYWADRLGYLTWGESSSWGCDPNDIEGASNFLDEWRQIVRRDRNRPSIIAWTPWNETHDIREPVTHRRTHVASYELCKALDPTRPVNDASGYIHQKTDIWTVHSYTQDPQELKTQLTPDDDNGVFRNIPDHEVPYAGQPYVIDEFGGIKWVPPERQQFADNSWGYGQGPRTLEEFYTRLQGQVQAIASQSHICGWCYTQLTDVEQEENGVYNYDRSEKFDMKRVRAIFSG